MAFDTEIQALAGTATTSEMSQWMTDGVKEIVNILPLELKVKCTSRTSITDLNGTDLDSKGEILYITRLSADSGGFEKACREILPMYGDLTNDSSDMMYYAVVTDPVYFKTNNASGNPTLFVRPNPTAAQPAYVHHISYPSITSNSDTTIANFPDEAEYLVVLYASIKVLQNKMNEKSGNLPSDISEVVLATISTSLPTYTSPDSFVLPVLPQGVDVNYSEVGDIGVFVPPTLNVKELTYTSPVIDYLDWSDANNWISTEEDSEMLQARIAEIQAKIADFTANMQNAQAVFGKENADVQAKLNKYGTDIQNETARVGSSLSEYQAEVQKALTSYQAETGYDISKYSAEVQANVQKFNSDLQDNSTDFMNNLQKYQAEIGKITETNQSKLGKYAQDLANYGAKIQKHSADYQWIHG